MRSLGVMPEWTNVLPGGPILLALLGLCLGSFLNVVIHRLPRGESLIRPGSHCPHCNTPIRPWHNIPLASFLALRGRCRRCGARISLRYPLVESLGGVAVWVAAYVSPTPGLAAVRAVFVLLMIAVFFIDLELLLIPDEITIPGMLGGIAAAPILGIGRMQSVAGLALGVVSLLAVALLYRLVRGREGMGMGDVKLAGFLGAVLGWKGMLATLFVGSGLGSLLGIGLIIGGRATRSTALPFGSFLAVAAIVVLMLGSRLYALLP
jgi:leader peptidase (prepilin peptidase)/N-methyltransferase